MSGAEVGGQAADREHVRGRRNQRAGLGRPVVDSHAYHGTFLQGLTCLLGL